MSRHLVRLSVRMVALGRCCLQWSPTGCSDGPDSLARAGRIRIYRDLLRACVIQVAISTCTWSALLVGHLSVQLSGNDCNLDRCRFLGRAPRLLSTAGSRPGMNQRVASLTAVGKSRIRGLLYPYLAFCFSGWGSGVADVSVDWMVPKSWPKYVPKKK